MNKKKEVMLQLCIIGGIFSSITLGVGSRLYRNSNTYYNGDKFKYEEKVEFIKTNELVKMDGYNIFMRIVNDNKVRIAKEKQIKEQKLLALKNKKLQLSKSNKNYTVSRGGNIEYDTVFICSFYSGLNCENSSAGSVGSRNVRLYDGCVASNVIPYGSKIRLQGWGEVEVLDSGGNHFDSPNRLDIYVPRDVDESDSQYYRRVQKLGKIKIQGKIIK